MIKFPCQKCGQRISVSDEYAGKSSRCPKCDNQVTIPKIDGQIELQPVLERAEVPEEKHEAEYYSPQRILTDDTETGERKLPWFIDIFLYPISASGLINLGLFFLGPFILSILSIALFPLAIIIFIMRMILAFYFCWYIAECVRDSATGGTRAPSVLVSNSDDLGGIFSAWANLIACYFACFGPAVFYRLITNQQDSIYWGLMGYSALSFPLLFLSVLIIDSASAWNPFMLIWSFIKLMPQYLIVSGVLFGVIWCLHAMPSIDNAVLSFFSVLIMSYVIFTGAHLLGRFYWLNRFRLDWG